MVRQEQDKKRALVARFFFLKTKFSLHQRYLLVQSRQKGDLHENKEKLTY